MSQADLPPTPWQRISVQKKSVISENKAAKSEGGRRVTGSGNKREKGDVRNSTWRIEDKFTDKESFSLKVSDWKKICHEAFHTPPGLLPQMRITFGGHIVRVLREEDYLWLCANAQANFDRESLMPEKGSRADAE